MSLSSEIVLPEELSGRWRSSNMDWKEWHMKSRFEKKWGLCWANISENYTCILSRILSSNITRGNRGTKIIQFFFKIKKRWILVSDRRRSNGNLSYSKSAKTRTKWPQKRRLEPFIWKKGALYALGTHFPLPEGTLVSFHFKNIMYLW